MYGESISAQCLRRTNRARIKRTISSYSAETKSRLVQYNTHSYSGTDRAGLHKAAEGKRIWNSEHGDGDYTGWTLSTNILKDIKEMGSVAWVYWQAVEPSGGWGMIETDLNNPNGDRTKYTMTKKYDVMEQWSKFIRPGYVIIDIADPESVAAYDRAESKLVIVSLNGQFEAKTVQYDLSRFGELSGMVTGYRTGGSERMASITGLSTSDKRFTATLPPASTSTFVITDAVMGRRE